jgi:hypothetical protein
MVSLYVSPEQNDWDVYVPTLAYAYNTAVHSVHGFAPMQLMMGRVGPTISQLQFPGVEREADAPAWNRALTTQLRRVRKVAAAAIEKSQASMARLYDQQVTRRIEWKPGMYVWIRNPARGKGVSKLKHRFRGPARLERDAGYDNWIVSCAWDNDAEIIVHSSACVPYGCSDELLRAVLRDIRTEDEVGESPWPVAASQPVDGVDDDDVDMFRRCEEVRELERFLGCAAPKSKAGSRDSARQADQRRQTAARLCEEVLAETDDCGIRRRRLVRSKTGRMVLEVEVRAPNAWQWVPMDAWDEERRAASGRYWVPRAARRGVPVRGSGSGGFYAGG